MGKTQNLDPVGDISCGRQDGNKPQRTGKMPCFLFTFPEYTQCSGPTSGGLHKIIDGWKSVSDKEGWKLMYAVMAAKEDGTWSQYHHQEPDEFVTPARRLKNDFEYLKLLTSDETPPKVIKLRNGLRCAYYGFGGTSGKVFGFAIEINGVSYSEFGQWSAVVESQHSNFKELKNLANAVEAAYGKG